MKIAELFMPSTLAKCAQTFDIAAANLLGSNAFVTGTFERFPLRERTQNPGKAAA